MNTKTLLTALVTSALLASSAQAAMVTGWVLTNTDGPGGTPESFQGGTAATDGPVVLNAGGSTITANFTPVTLADGDSISLTGTFSINSASLAQQFRWGLFDGDNPVTAGDGLGYSGYFMESPSTAANSDLVYTNGTATNPFSTAVGTTNLAPLPLINAQVAANTVVTYVLTITRDGSDLNIQGSITDGGVDYTSSILHTESTNLLYTFDSAGFLIGGTYSDTATATFSNVDVTYTPVPEPSSLALLGLGGLGLISFVRRCKR